MAELAGTDIIVHKRYQTMQAWSVAFFKGTFWDYVRHDQDTDMLSEHEYFLKHKEDLEKCAPIATENQKEEFDFSKIIAGNQSESIMNMNSENALESLSI